MLKKFKVLVCRMYNEDRKISFSAKNKVVGYSYGAILFIINNTFKSCFFT